MNSSSSFGDIISINVQQPTTAHAALLMVWFLSISSSPGQTYKVIHEFSASEGRNWMTPMVLSGTTLYGATSGSGSDYGRIFKINADGTDFTVLKVFTNWFDGAYPRGSLALSGGVLYGATSGGGIGSMNGGSGVVFRMNIDGSGYAVLSRFGSVGGGPLGGVLLYGSTLYGTTIAGGWSPPGSIGWGSVFRVNTDGTGFNEIKKWNTTDGPYPFQPEVGLARSGDTLYGTTSQGGTSGYGIIFRINIDGSGYAVIKNLCCDGPFGVMSSGDSLYGTTGNMNGLGSVYRVNTNGSSYTILKQFTSDGERSPLGGLVLSGTALYGTTGGGGISNNGVVFRIDTNGYSIVKHFQGSDGSTPTATLTLAGSMLYGLTSYGGSADCGVIFALGYPPPAQTAYLTQTVEAGSGALFSTDATDDPSAHFQWCLNGKSLSGCANPYLQLTSVTSTQSGDYTVIITNLFGAITSAPAMLNVIAPVPRRTVPAIRLTGDLGSVLHLSSADTLGPGAGWQVLDAVTLTATPQFYLDLTRALPPARFYRAWQTNGPSVAPVLDLSLATELTLTGAIGSKVRVDAINRFGPIDAWFPLATVTLTNTLQPYFDISVRGQAQRLYRLVQVP